MLNAMYRFRVFAPVFILLAFALVFSTSSIIAQEKDGEKEKKAEERYSWKQLFDGKTLKGWSVPQYGGDGEVSVKDGCIVIGQGAMITGIKYDNVFPLLDYEIRYEAKRAQGNDFFAALTFPVGGDCCTFVNGGWGGGTIGLSCVDGYDASENQTSSFFSFKDNVWYKFRVRVTGKSIKIWIDEPTKDGKWKETQAVDLDTAGVKISLRDETSAYKPLGVCTWVSEGHLRDVEYRQLKPEEVNAKPENRSE